MLVESMTHAEVYRELDRDRDTATTWWRHHLDTLRRPVLKARQLPLIHWADYTSPARRIRYLFFTRIFDKRMRRLLTGVAVPHSTPDGTAVYTSWLSDQRLIAPMVILPHAWRRYRERMYYIVVCKDDEEKVRAEMKQHSEIEVVGYVDRLAHIVATPGKVQFVGTKKAQPIRWEARRDSAVSAYFNRRIY